MDDFKPEPEFFPIGFGGRETFFIQRTRVQILIASKVVFDNFPEKVANIDFDNWEDTPQSLEYVLKKPRPYPPCCFCQIFPIASGQLSLLVKLAPQRDNESAGICDLIL